MVSLCFSLCLCLGVWCPSFRPASLLCRKPRSESTDTGGEVPSHSTFPCGVVGNTVGSHPATPGSIPGKGDLIFSFFFLGGKKKMKK